MEKINNIEIPVETTKSFKYCTKCVQPNTRPGIRFDEHGVCPACRFAEQTDKIDWMARRHELESIAEFGKKHNVSGYDCIIGVSGGKDSTRQSLYIREELGLKPLLVSCSYPPEQVTERGAHNISNLISLGFDCILVSPNPQIWKALMRESFFKFGNWCKPTEMALYASAPKIAIAYHIPLIFLGENPAIALGDLNVGSVNGDANKMKYCHTLDGGRPDNLLVKGMLPNDLFWYYYPTDEEMEWTKLRIVFLGYFMKDFTRFKNAEFSVSHGLMIRDEPPEEIGDNYGFEALDDDFVIVNQMFKYFKFGFGKVTDQVSEAVRLGMMKREKAVGLVKKYDGKCADKYIKRFCRYLEISEDEFWKTAERFRNKNIWEKDKNSSWKLKTELV